ncbi:MAG: ATPase domain-containing protein, partial [archaeon]
MNQKLNKIRENLGLEKVEEPGTEVIPFNNKALDEMTGIGGIPQGRITEIYGQPSVGKTTLSLWLASSAMDKGLTPFYVDCDNSLSGE